ncbi:GTP-binding protein [Lanmaoa asiatica]|nr:GTP-binding protein [Lanmaoa asiatica]
MSEQNTENFKNLQDKFGRFRILIVGRANAGKTTILRGICNSTENPEIYDTHDQIDPSQVEGTRGRGIHNVENELIFRSNEKLVFHDSQGFEAGREDEFLQMKRFIADRARTTILKKRIHAIWYCIPMDKLDRAIQRAEEMFFEDCDPGNVPVLVLFTKFDALLPVALGKLAPGDRRLPLQERLSKARGLIEGIFNRADVWGRLAQTKYAPKASVQIEGMHKSNEGCKILLETTTSVLSEGALQMLLVSAQEANIALCVKYAVQEWVGPMNYCVLIA